MPWCGFFPKEVKARDPRIVDENSLTVMDRQFKVTSISYCWLQILSDIFKLGVIFRKLFKLSLYTLGETEFKNFIKKKTNRSTTIKLS